VNDAVDRLLVEREAMDRGLPAGVMLSITAHVALVGGSLLAAILMPKAPLIQVADGFSVALPPGGGGIPNAPAPAPLEPAAPAVTEPAAPPASQPPQKILKPPKEEKRKGLPEPDAKRSKKPEKSPPPVPRGGVAGGTGTSTQTPGLEFAPPGPGTPGGTDLLGDWYLAAVQRKIWVLWTQQIRPSHTQPVVVRLTILADGSATDVEPIQSSGISLVDRAAVRAILSAAPFGPLPRNYGTDRYTITATFRPTE
jgi:TonB family protein